MNNDKKSKRGKLFVIFGPSGAGKTTLALACLNNLKNEIPISKIVTYTTRPPRAGEKDGQDYVFISPASFKEKEKAGDFIETSSFNNNLYGSPRTILNELAQGKSILVVTDRSGAQSYQKAVPHAFFIWITTPSLGVLEQRLKKRGTESESLLKQRLALAEQEMLLEKAYPLHDIIIINDEFDKAHDELCSIVIQHGAHTD